MKSVEIQGRRDYEKIAAVTQFCLNSSSGFFQMKVIFSNFAYIFMRNRKYFFSPEQCKFHIVHFIEC